MGEWAVGQGPAGLPLEPARVFDRVRVGPLVEASMGLAIRLIVSGQVHASSRDPSGHGCLPDGASGGAAVVFELTRTADVHRENLSRGSCHGYRVSSWT